MNLSKKKILGVLKSTPNQLKFLTGNASAQLVKPGCQTFVSLYGLGDTYLLCLLSEEWKKKHNLNVYFVIKPSHKFILEFAGISNFTVFDLTKIPLFLLAFLNPWTRVSEKKIFIAHMRMHLSFKDQFQQFRSGGSNMMELYKKFLGLQKTPGSDLFFENAKAHLPKANQSGLDLSKLVFLSPTANTLTNSDVVFWDSLRAEILKRGYKILENADRVNLYTQEGATQLSLTLKDLVSLGVGSKLAITFRSGLSDLFHQKTKHAVIYPDRKSMDQYGLRAMYGASPAQEMFMDDQALTKILSLLNDEI